MDIKIVDLTKEQIDEDNFAYAICECTLSHEGIKIPRKDNAEFISFNCPRCGKELGVMVSGKKTIKINGNIAQAPTAKKRYHCFYVSGGSDPKDICAALNVQLDSLNECGWTVERIDCHDNPFGGWNSNERCYYTTKVYIIFAYVEGEE